MNGEELSDAQLVQHSLSGRLGYFDQLVARYLKTVQGVCYSKIGYHPDIEDLVQETFLRGFRSLARLQDPEKVGGWFYGIAHRVCLDWLRKKAIRKETPLEKVAEPAQTEPADTDTGPLLNELHNLPDPLKEVLVLKYYDKKSYQEMAQVLGISQATINARLRKARTLLRDRLKKVGL